ncbi:hypothetical protein HYU92_02100 [Candidatus Curtissbacteria bacterium]|nr:hypothetical protein [Candidatus Curtissbacteria bacterium]
MEGSEIGLVGVTHSELWVAEKNFRYVMQILERLSPGFVTLEVGLHDITNKSFFGRALRAKANELEGLEQEYLEKPPPGAEYIAAIIYCKKNNIPLYFVDLYDGSLEEVTSVNITDLEDPSVVWNDSGALDEETLKKLADNVERNKFMAKAIDKVANTFPNSVGVHIGGDAHLRGKESLQNLISSRNTRLFEIPY